MSDFEHYANKLKTDKPNIDNNGLLKLYGLYKQATVGDVNTEKPGMFGGMEAGYKWSAWEAEKGKTQDEAKAEYVTLAKGHLGE